MAGKVRRWRHRNRKPKPIPFREKVRLRVDGFFTGARSKVLFLVLGYVTAACAGTCFFTPSLSGVPFLFSYIAYCIIAIIFSLKLHLAVGRLLAGFATMGVMAAPGLLRIHLGSAHGMQNFGFLYALMLFGGFGYLILWGMVSTAAIVRGGAGQFDHSVERYSEGLHHWHGGSGGMGSGGGCGAGGGCGGCGS